MAGTLRQSWARLLEAEPTSTRYTRYNALSDLVVVGVLSLSAFLITLLLGLPEPLLTWSVAGTPAPAFAALYASLAVGFVAVAARRWRELDVILRNRDRAERELAARTRELEEADAELRRLRADRDRVAGEGARFLDALRSGVADPLAGVRGDLGVLRERCGESMPDDARGLVKQADVELAGMGRFLSNLRAYAVVDRGEMKLEPVDLEAVLEDVLGEMRSAVEGTRATVDWVGLPTVTADRAHVSHLLYHLLANALRFRGDSRPEVALRAHRGDGRWCVEVSDRGVGVPPGEREEVLELFRRGAAGEAAGTRGVGLALARRVVERHGGTIALESRGSRGTRVRFTLPMRG